MKPTILLTGFEAFGGSSRNPSREAVLRLAGLGLPEARLEARILPVDYEAAPEQLIQMLDQLGPRALLCLGEKTHGDTLCIERLGVNLLDFRIADNSGAQPSDEPIDPGGPAAYFSTLPVQAMLRAAQDVGVPARLSLSAGAFLCNQVLYTALHHIARVGLPTAAGFVHLPSLPEQVAAGERSGPSLALDTALRGLEAMLCAVGSTLQTA